MSSDLQRYAAVNARVRALLATLLGRPGLEALYSYPTANALLEAIARTPYGTALLMGATPEVGLTGRAAAVGRTLLRMVTGREAAFLHTYLLRDEVENFPSKRTERIVIQSYHRSSPRSLAPNVRGFVSQGAGAWQ